MADKLISLAELSRATPSKPVRGASEQLPPGAPPTLQDLTECLMFSPGDGRIWLNGARMLLIHNSGIGAMSVDRYAVTPSIRLEGTNASATQYIRLRHGMRAWSATRLSTGPSNASALRCLHVMTAQQAVRPANTT